jgi:hypothetical protein
VKVGLIPPRGYESYALLSNYHLVLAPELTRVEYRSVYSVPKTELGFVTVDNGAYEGSLVTNEMLVKHASGIKANELVLPDSMGDSVASVKLMSEFLSWPGRRWFAGDFMGVAHGSSKKEILECVGWMAEQPSISTVGLPKILFNTYQSSFSARIELANAVKEKYGNRFKIHFLGADPRWQRELYHVAKNSPHVRSIDTSLPFCYTMAGTKVSSEASIGRPRRYFNDTLQMDLNLLHYNIRTYLDWSQGR